MFYPNNNNNMAYLPKELILKSYLALSSLTEDHKQGQTQIVSAVRHFFALDMFFKEKGKDCNLNSLEDKNIFIKNVKKLVNVKGDYYTTNFYTTIKPIEDCGVGSNFTSVGVVNNSKQNTSQIYDYPTRGQYPLFKVHNAVMTRETSYYKNIKHYLNTEMICAAFVIWILRNEYFTELNLSAIKMNLLSFVSQELIDSFMPKDENLASFIEHTSLSDTKYQTEPSDILSLFQIQRKNTKKNKKYRPYITAIKSKPFLLLAGISGTGKSRIVRELARAYWDEGSEEYEAQKPRNFEMVQVKPNWHDSSELIGYVSRIDGERYVVGPFLKFLVKAMKDPDVPYFLCLDEMNLAPVEQYFAEYLSVVESRKSDGEIVSTDPIIEYEATDAYKSLIDQLFFDDEETRLGMLKEKDGLRLTIPQNLIVVGTVNMDETTFSFSRKVLDRAMTIEMNEVDLNGGLTNRHEPIGKLGAEDLIGTAVEGVDIYDQYQNVCNMAINYLQGINDKLEGTPFKVAYRTRNEVLLYVVNNLPYNQNDDGEEIPQDYVIARALDEITNMKILARIEGDDTKVSMKFLESLESEIKVGLETVCSNLFTEEETKQAYKAVSLAKLDEMKKRLSSGYTSFWS